MLEFLVHIKLYHWNTTSHARHLASDKLHESLQSLVDQFTECYIGRYGRKTVMAPIKQGITLKTHDDKAISRVLAEFIQFLEQDIPRHCKSSDLLNIRDEMLAQVTQAQYLFTLN
jgi:hypothetical protein